MRPGKSGVVLAWAAIAPDHPRMVKEGRSRAVRVSSKLTLVAHGLTM
jgi:hypothetical protein